MRRILLALAGAAFLWVGPLLLVPGLAFSQGVNETNVAANLSAAEGNTVPPVMQFSGVLQDSAGRPLTGVQGVTFALYREQEGGSPL